MTIKPCMLHAIIIDDDHRDKEILELMLNKYCPDIAITGYANSINTAYQLILDKKPELIFLDIELGTETGFDLLSKFSSYPFKIIFVTAFDKYAIRAIKFSALDYILKPVNIDELVAAVQKAKEQTAPGIENEIRNLLKTITHPGNTTNQIAIPTINGFQLLAVGEIMYCEADKEYTYIHSVDQPVICSALNLGEYENLLEGYSFFRVHHSYIVNKQHISQYIKGEGGELVMNNNSKLPVSRRKKKDVVDWLTKKLLVFILFLFSITAKSQTPVSELFKKLETAKDSNRVKLLFDIANYYVGISRFDSNKIYLQKALDAAIESNYEHGRSRALTGLGYMFRTNGEYDSALVYFFESLRLKEKMKLPLEAAALHDAIGRVYISLEEPDKAIEYFNFAKNTYESFKDSARLIPLGSEIAGYYATKGDYQTALTKYQATLDVYNRWLRDSVTKLSPRFLANYRSNAITNTAYCLIELKRPQEAVDLLVPLLQERKPLGGGTVIAIQSYLSLAYLRTGNYAEALKLAKESTTLIKNSNLKLRDELRDNYRNAAEANFALGNYKEAYEDYRAFKYITDTLNSEQSTKLIAEMQTRFETDKKDQQIKQLDAERRSQQLIIGLSIVAALVAIVLLIFAYRFFQKRKEIERNALQNKMNELEQMALRAQMNPHFIFNCLNSVQHFIVKQDIEGVNKYLTSFAHLIRQTLDNSSKQMIPLEEEIKYLDTYLTLEKIKSENKFNYEISVAEPVDKYSTFVPGMILQPFIENSIKHGVASVKNNSGYIKISITQNGKLYCTIEDNGVGRIKASNIKTSQSPLYESKGLSLTLSRIEVINKMYNTDVAANTYDITDADGNVKGTKVVVEFPLNME